jgi:hypothetical protein
MPDRTQQRQRHHLKRVGSSFRPPDAPMTVITLTNQQLTPLEELKPSAIWQGRSGIHLETTWGPGDPDDYRTRVIEI